jgi:hypothetical protein
MRAEEELCNCDSLLKLCFSRKFLEVELWFFPRIDRALHDLLPKTVSKSPASAVVVMNFSDRHYYENQ